MNRQSNLYREIPDGIIRKIFAHTLQEETVWETALLDAGLTEESRSRIYRLLGVYLAKLHLVTGESFGFLSRICSGKKFSTWSTSCAFPCEG